MAEKKCLSFTLFKKKFSNVINIHIQNPKISSKKFSHIVVPNHDNLKGVKNIINSIGIYITLKIKNNQKKIQIQIKKN